MVGNAGDAVPVLGLSASFWNLCPLAAGRNLVWDCPQVATTAFEPYNKVV